MVTNSLAYNSSTSDVSVIMDNEGGGEGGSDMVVHLIEKFKKDIDYMQLEVEEKSTNSISTTNKLHVARYKEFVKFTVNLFHNEDDESVTSTQLKSMVNYEVANLKKLAASENIMQFVGTCLDDEDNFLVVMEYVNQGLPLHNIIHDNKLELSIVQVLTISKGMANGLHFIYENDMYHGNLTPDSVMVQLHDDLSKIKVMLFNLRRLPSIPSVDSFIDGKVGQFPSIMYLAPELLPPKIKLPTIHSDIYSLGVLVWQLLARDTPYNPKQEVVQVIQQKQEGKIPTLNSDLNRFNSICNFIYGCQHPDLEMRLTIEEIISYFNNVYSENRSTTYNLTSSTFVELFDLPYIEGKPTENNEHSLLDQLDTIYHLTTDLPLPVTLFFGSLYYFGDNLSLAIRSKVKQTFFNLVAEHVKCIDKNGNSELFRTTASKSGYKLDTDGTRIYDQLINHIIITLNTKTSEHIQNLILQICRITFNPNDSNTQFNLSIMYLYGLGKKMKLNEAFYLLSSAVTQLNPLAMNLLGDMYYYGLGTSFNFKQALGWYKQAARYNLKYSQFKLAKMYVEGRGTIQNVQLAYDYFFKAANNNHHLAMLKLSQIYLKEEANEMNLQAAFNWANHATFTTLSSDFKTDNLNGCHEAKLLLSKLYLNGIGTPKNPNLAFENLVEANLNNKGDLDSNFLLAICYYYGIGCLPNEPKGIDLLLDNYAANHLNTNLALATLNLTSLTQTPVTEHTLKCILKLVHLNNQQVLEVFRYLLLHDKFTTQIFDWLKLMDLESVRIFMKLVVNYWNSDTYNPTLFSKTASDFYKLYTVHQLEDSYYLLGLCHQLNTDPQIYNLETARIYYTVASNFNHKLASKQLDKLENLDLDLKMVLHKSGFGSNKGRVDRKKYLFGLV